MNYRYKFDPSSKKYTCPSCQKKRFVRYIDIETNQLLSGEYGKCDREANCGYYLSPKSEEPQYTPPKQKKKPSSSILPNILWPEIYKDFDKNTFLKPLTGCFSNESLKWIIKAYGIGTIKHFSEYYCVFPYIDTKGQIRAMQAKTFDNNLHTLKTNFVHSILEKRYYKQNRQIPEWLQLYINSEKKVSCLFGEHLLGLYPNNPIALVEAPKTALIASLEFGFPKKSNDDFLWLAVYNLSSLTKEKVSVLKDRKVVLFPDLSKTGSAFELWSNRAKEFGSNFIVSDYLEKNASPEAKEKGFDLADYLLQK